MSKIYLTHDNGARPFKVELNYKNKIINVFNNNNGIKLYLFNYTNIWIGKSPKTEATIFSGGYGTKFDGNSILIETSNLQYIYIGEMIFSFKSITPIKKYLSPVGNNDVPYPYAIDIKGYIYLMIENVILKPHQKTKDLLCKNNDPYNVYYNLNLISKSENKPNENEFNYDITHLIIGEKNEGNFYNFRYNPEPKKEYERLRKINCEVGEQISILTSKKKFIKISKEKFVDINKKWGKIYGFQKIKNKKILVKRDW